MKRKADALGRPHPEQDGRPVTGFNVGMLVNFAAFVGGWLSFVMTRCSSAARERVRDAFLAAFDHRDPSGGDVEDPS